LLSQSKNVVEQIHWKGCKSSVRWAADVLWAKKAKPGEAERWLPLIVHMADTAEVARLMWRDWLPDGTKRRITEGLGF
jgi:CRISPR-associated endonuclease/helicase Cas3